MSHKKIAPFLTKLYEIVNDRNNKNTVKWSQDGESFTIENLSEFCDKILPKYFKHTNFASFVRQLNMYDFHKNKIITENSFFHQNFKRDRMELLERIKRKNNDQNKRPIRSKKKRLEFESLKDNIEKIINNIQLVSEKIDTLERKYTNLEVNQKNLFDFNHLQGKKLASLIEKDQYIEKLLVFVLKLVSQNFNINYDVKFSDTIKSEQKQPNNICEVNPYNKGGDFFNKILKDIISPINYHQLKTSSVENLAEGLKSESKNFGKNANNFHYNLNEIKNNTYEKRQIKEENEMNLNCIGNSMNSKSNSQKNLNGDSTPEDKSKALKILTTEEEINTNFIMPYESISNIISKVLPKKSSMTIVDYLHNNMLPLEENFKSANNLKVDKFKADDYPIHNQVMSNELANINSLNVIEILTNLLNNKNSLPSGEEKKINESFLSNNINSLALLSKKRKFSDISQDERSISSNYKCEIENEKEKN